jgi:hypothetical protein
VNNRDPPVLSKAELDGNQAISSHAMWLESDFLCMSFFPAWPNVLNVAVNKLETMRLYSEYPTDLEI